MGQPRIFFAMSRDGLLPPVFGKVHPIFKTPVNALLLNTGIGIIALLTGKTGDIITIACFGAIALYIFAMVSVLVLRKTAPELPRPFKTPFFPFFPIVALMIAMVSMVAMATLNVKLFLLFLGILVLAYIWFHFFVKQSADATTKPPSA